MHWHRDLTTTELEQVQILLLTIGRTAISLVHADRVVWRASSNKRFSVHNLYDEVLHNITSHDQIIMPDVWLNLSPAKTELFLWFALLDKLPTKDRLFSIGLCSLAMNKCVFCGQFGETANHLLFLCNKSWQLWSFFYNWLGVEVATPSSLLLWFQLWKSLVQGHKQCQF